MRQVLRWGKDKKNLEIVVPPMPSFAKGRFRVVKRGRPYLTGAAWKKLTRMAGLAALGAEKKSQLPRLRGRPINVERSRELYWFMLIAVGGALRTGEAYSLRWQDCEETTLRDVNGKNTAAIHARVLGKHSRSGEREDAYILYGGEHAFHEMKKAREGAAPGDRLFRYNHETGFRSLLKAAHLYHDLKSGMTRNTKSCRVTGICLRLENNPNVALRDIARWARTSVAIAEAYYDQIHPEASAARVAGFKTQEPKKQVTRRSKQEPKTDTKGKRRRTKKKPDAPSEEPS